MGEASNNWVALLIGTGLTIAPEKVDLEEAVILEDMVIYYGDQVFMLLLLIIRIWNYIVHEIPG